MFNRCTIIELLYNTTVGTQEFELPVWQNHFESKYSQQLCMLTTLLVALTTGKHFCSAERDVPSCPIPNLVTSLMRIDSGLNSWPIVTQPAYSLAGYSQISACVESLGLAILRMQYFFLSLQ